MRCQTARLAAALILSGAVPVLSVAVPAVAAQPRTSHSHPPQRPAHTGPKRIGKWEDWQAATYQEAGQTVCYAFTRPVSSSPAIPGRGDVVLTVTDRPGTQRDAVALSAGFAYAPNAEVELTADGATLRLYTSGRSAFARDAPAAMAMFGKARQAVARSPAPRGGTVTDTFSLRGFGAAVAAIKKVCGGR